MVFIGEHLGNTFRQLHWALAVDGTLLAVSSPHLVNGTDNTDPPWPDPSFDAEGRTTWPFLC